LPSAPGPHIDQITALGDNQWLALGPPAPDPQWGSGRGRSWSSYMSYAPELRGAFLIGEGQHGFVKPDGRFDDIFFYDANANRWIGVFPGLETTTLASDVTSGVLGVREDGQLTDGYGNPIPGGTAAHSYQSHTYATGLRRFISVAGDSGFVRSQHNTADPWYQAAQSAYAALMAGKTDTITWSPFVYDTVAGRFERQPWNVKVCCGANNVLYDLPTKDRLWLYATPSEQNGQRTTTWLGDYASRSWVDSGATGAGPTGIDFGGCYDSRRDRIYLGASAYGLPEEQDKIFTYDVATNAWSVRTTGTTLVTSNYGLVHYDPVADRVIEILSDGVHALDPDTFTWSSAALALPPDLPTTLQWHGFYSPELNVHFLYFAGDSDDRGQMWVYRYKR
jgi:hypothetical protein